MDCIKGSIDVNMRDYKKQVVHDQAFIRQEYFLAFMLQDIEARILVQSPENKCNDSTHIMVIEQFFQGIGLTEWTNIVMNHCPEASDCTKDNVVEYKKD